MVGSALLIIFGIPIILMALTWFLMEPHTFVEKVITLFLCGCVGVVVFGAIITAIAIFA